jgi:hypothetical protein
VHNSQHGDGGHAGLVEVTEFDLGKAARVAKTLADFELEFGPLIRGRWGAAHRLGGGNVEFIPENGGEARCGY